MSTSYSITRDEVISLALRKLGVLEIGDTPDTSTLNNASMSLNLLVKQFSADGLKLWKNSELLIPLFNTQTTYVLGGPSSALMYDVQSDTPNIAIQDKPLKIIQGFYRKTTVTPPIDTPVLLLSKQEYNILGSKASTGTANSLFYDPKRTSGILYVYLTPDAYSESNLELHVVAQLPLNDITGGADLPDFPNEWLNCLVWNLADQLSIEYGVPMNYRQEIMARALLYKDKLTDWDVEATSTYFQPDFRSVTNNSYNR